MKRLLLTVAGAAVLLLLTCFATAQPASALRNVPLSSGSGTVTRAKFYEHENLGGYAITYKGSGNCTSTTGDLEYRLSKMPVASDGESWNNKISSFQDFASCDVKFWKEENWGGDHLGFLNGGTAGLNLINSWNDQVSSFVVS